MSTSCRRPSEYYNTLLLSPIQQFRSKIFVLPYEYSATSPPTTTRVEAVALSVSLERVTFVSDGAEDGLGG